VTGCPLNNLANELACADAEFRVEVDQLFEHWRRVLADKLRADHAAGRLEVSDPDAVATFVIAAYSGAMTLAKAGQTTAPLKTCAAQLHAALATMAPRA
jgi:hypothetical protein